MSLLNGALKLFNGALSQDGTENAVLRKIFQIIIMRSDSVSKKKHKKMTITKNFVRNRGPSFLNMKTTSQEVLLRKTTVNSSNSADRNSTAKQPKNAKITWTIMFSFLLIKD